MNSHAQLLVLFLAVLISQPWLQAQPDSGLHPPLTLEAKDAVLKGPALHYNPVFRRLVDWQNRDDIATFDLPELPAGEYALSLSYTGGPNSGGRLRANWNDKTVTKHIRQTGGWAKAADVSLGMFQHDGGAGSLSLQADSIDKAALMEFVSLTIRQTSSTRVPSGPAALPKAPAQKPATNSSVPRLADGPSQEARLKISVPVEVSIDGKAAGTMTLPAGTSVSVLEAKDSKVRVRWKHLEHWVDVSALDLPALLQTNQETPAADVPAPSTTAQTEDNAKPAEGSGRLLADWDFSKAKKHSKSITIPNGPEMFGGPLMADEPDWAEVVEDKTAPQGLAVKFDGSSGQGLSSKAAVDIEKGAEIRIEIDINPSQSSDSQQRIIRVGNSFELRLIPESKGLQLLVWNEAKKYSKIEGQLNFGAWNNVAAACKEGALEITVNGETVRKNLPSDMIMRGGSSKALVAYSFENQAFTGLIGSIRITTQAPPETSDAAGSSSGTPGVVPAHTPPPADTEAPEQADGAVDNS